MEQDHGEKVRELEEAWAEVEAAAAVWEATEPAPVRAANVSARNVEQQSRIRLVFAAFR